MTRLFCFFEGIRAPCGERIPSLFAKKRRKEGRGEKVKCRLCHRDAQGLICLRVYTSKGINVCMGCYQAIDEHHNQPYSRVMKRLAVAEAGYQANRKRAKIRGY
jgi:hypothetical protein